MEPEETGRHFMGSVPDDDEEEEEHEDGMDSGGGGGGMDGLGGGEDGYENGNGDVGDDEIGEMEKRFGEGFSTSSAPNGSGTAANGGGDMYGLFLFCVFSFLCFVLFCMCFRAWAVQALDPNLFFFFFFC